MTKLHQAGWKGLILHFLVEAGQQSSQECKILGFRESEHKRVYDLVAWGQRAVLAEGNCWDPHVGYPGLICLLPRTGCITVLTISLLASSDSFLFSFWNL